MDERGEEKEQETVSEMAVKVGEHYVSIHESDEGLDYSILDANYHLQDGGVISDMDIPIEDALKQVIEDMGEGGVPTVPVDYEDLSDKADVVAQADMEAGRTVLAFREKTKEMFHEIDGQTPEDIENSVKAYIEEKLAENDIDADVVDVVVSGSRCRGIEQEGSDLDVVVEYRGDVKEDTVFNILNEDSFYVGDIKVDINPITEDKTGTLATYLPEVEKYLEEKMEAQSQVRLTVAECSEFHNLGELHEGITTVEEAIALWEDIPAERMHGIKSIGVECVDSSGETLDVDIVMGNKIDLITLTYVPEIYENDKALDMIAQLIDHYPKMEIIGDIPPKLEERLESLYEQSLTPADRLADEIDNFMHDFDPHEYNDQVEDRQAQVDIISKDLQTGEAGYITSYLQEIISQGAGTTEEQQKAQELIAQIQEYKPLAKVEEMEEQNYNQIDNVLNNGFEQKKEEKEKEARGEDKSDKRPSLKKRLEEKKEQVASEPGKPVPEKDKDKKRGGLEQ